jgi:hypothetical protein
LLRPTNVQIAATTIRIEIRRRSSMGALLVALAPALNPRDEGGVGDESAVLVGQVLRE